MECQCFDVGYAEFGHVLKDKIVKAQKSHVCGECRKTIELGECYRYEVIVCDGHFSTYKTCLDCDSARENLVCSYYYGQLWDLIEEGLGYEQPWSKIGELTKPARDRVLKIIEKVLDIE